MLWRGTFLNSCAIHMNMTTYSTLGPVLGSLLTYHSFQWEEQRNVKNVPTFCFKSALCTLWEVHLTTNVKSSLWARFCLAIKNSWYLLSPAFFYFYFFLFYYYYNYLFIYLFIFFLWGRGGDILQHTKRTTVLSSHIKQHLKIYLALVTRTMCIVLKMLESMGLNILAPNK